MKDIFKNKWFWVAVVVLLIVIAILAVARNIKIDGSKGGILEGPSHAQGGIKTEVKESGGKLEVQGGEVILMKEAMDLMTKIKCEGTPIGIASAINNLTGGESFSDSGKCKFV